MLARASKRLSDGQLVVIGGALLALGFGFFVAEATASIYVGVVLLALGNGLMWPSVLAVLSRLAGDELQGAAQGVAGSIGAVASILGLILGGLLYGLLGAWVFVGSGAAVLAGCAVAIPLRKHNPSDPHRDSEA